MDLARVEIDFTAGYIDYMAEWALPSGVGRKGIRPDGLALPANRADELHGGHG